MKIVSQGFKDALKGIKELIGVVSYKSVNGNIYNVLSTEGGSLLTTEAGKLLATTKSLVNISNEDINSINIAYDGRLLKTICKSLQMELKSDIDLNSKINVKIGVMVDDAYEYIDYGYFYNIEPSEYQLDSKTYVVTAYDRMYKTMIRYDDDPLDVFPITHKNLLTTILEKCEIEYNLSSYDNEDEIIEKDYWLGENVTYRDILDELCTSGGFGALIIDDKFVNRVYTETQEIVDDENLQSSSVEIGDVFGPINYVEISDTNDITYVIGTDDSSIENNGLTKVNLGVNRILANNDGSMYSSVFNAIKGLQFHTYNLSTYGLLMFEPLDMFKVEHEEIEYPLLLLNDSITLTTGLKEDLYLKKPEENVDTYVSSAINNDKIKNAIVKVDKANAEVVLKVNSDGKIAQVKLNGNADDGSLIDLDADQVNFKSHTFNLTSDNIKIESENFSVDEAGNMVCSNAKLTNGILDLKSEVGQPAITLTSDTSLGTSEFYNNNLIFGWNGAVLTNIGTLGDGINENGLLSLADYTGNVTIQMLGETGQISCDVIEATDIYYENLYPSSLEEKKKNFEKFENALDIIKDVDIYKYNYKTEENGTKKHIGLVIGDKFNYRQEVTSKDNNGADIYSMVGVLWKAVQEQQKQIEELKKEVANGNRKD